MNDLYTLTELALELDHPVARVRYVINGDASLKAARWVGPTQLFDQGQREIIREKLAAIKPRPRGAALLAS